MGLVPVFNPGDRFEELEIRRKIGSGAFGTVYLAHDQVIERDVALKIIPAGIDSRDQHRALREARAVGRLAHPHVAALYRVHSSEALGAWLFEMEYVAGRSLAEMLAQDSVVPVDKALRMARSIADALAHAHSRDVIHGDVKPGNVLVGDDGTVKLVDFGLARLMGDVSLMLSQSDRPGGTPLYMAPEVVMGDEPAPSTDVWSFGVLLYRLLQGRTPFVGRGMSGLVHSILNEEPIPMGSEVPLSVQELVTHCLQKDESLRPASGHELLVALDALAPTSVKTPTTARPQPLTRVRHKRYGQNALMRRVQPVLDSLLRSDGRVLLISGEAGSGKSALLRTIRDRSRTMGARWVECTVSKLQGFQRPLLAALQEAIGIRDDEHPALDISVSTRKLIHALYGDDTDAPVKDELQLYWVVEQVLRTLAQQGPLCLAVEDAHLSDEQDARLLRHLAHYLSREGVLFAVTCRADESHADPAYAMDAMLGISGALHMQVEPLRDSDICALIEEQFGTSRVDTTILDRVAKLSQGNPLLCAELTRHLRESGAVLVGADTVKPGPTWETAPLPRRMRDLAAARLATLSEEERELLDIAAVDGIEFDGRALAAICGEPALRVMRSLQRIARKQGIVRPTSTGYRFAGTAMQEVIYLDLAAEMRRALHRALAEHLESRDEATAALRLGIHWDRAGDRERARPYLRAATSESIRLFEHSRAVALAARSGLAPSQLDVPTALEHAELLLALAPAYRAVGSAEECIALLGTVAEAAKNNGDARLAMRAEVGLNDALYFHRGRDAVDAALLARAVEQLGDCAESAQASEMLGVIAKFGQHYDEAERHLRTAHRMAHKLDLGFRVARTLNELASISMRRGRLREAEALYADSARVADHVGHRVNAAVSRVNGAIARFSRGELVGVADRIERSIHEMSFDGAPNSAGQTQIVLANVLWSEGRSADALRATESGLAVLEQTQHLPGLSTALRLKSELLGCGGDLEAAWKLYERAHALLVRVNNRRIERTVHALAMRFHLWAGNPGQGAVCAEPCIEQLRVDPGEAASITIDLGEGLLYGLPDTMLETLHRTVHDAQGDTPEIEAARSFFDMAWQWRQGEPPTRKALDAFRSAPLAYSRTRIHAEALLMATDSDEDAWRQVRETAQQIGHVWLELACLERWACAKPASIAVSAHAELRARLLPDSD